MFSLAIAVFRLKGTARLRLPLETIPPPPPPFATRPRSPFVPSFQSFSAGPLFFASPLASQGPSLDHPDLTLCVLRTMLPLSMNLGFMPNRWQVLKVLSLGNPLPPKTPQYGDFFFLSFPRSPFAITVGLPCPKHPLPLSCVLRSLPIKELYFLPFSLPFSTP